MKKCLLVMTICCLIGQLQLASAQSAELQQLALNIEKLAQFKRILSDMKKGYEVASRGYERIRSISQGNFNLHEVFLDGLLLANPELARYRRVADIVRFQGQILTEYRSAFNRFKSGGRFSPKEINYLAQTYSNLMDRCLDNIDELTMILTSGKLRMSDEERLKAINRLYFDTQDKLTALRRFNRNVSGVDKGRANQLRQVENLRKLYGQP